METDSKFLLINIFIIMLLVVLTIKVSSSHELNNSLKIRESRLLRGECLQDIVLYTSEVSAVDINSNSAENFLEINFIKNSLTREIHSKRKESVLISKCKLKLNRENIREIRQFLKVHSSCEQVETIGEQTNLKISAITRSKSRELDFLLEELSRDFNNTNCEQFSIPKNEY